VTFFADGVMVALRDADGGLQGYGKLFRDATARRQAEDELARVRADAERRRRLFEVALSNTPDLVYVLDLEHRFVYANEALLRIWGFGWDAAIGRDFRQLGYPEASAAQLDHDTERAISERQPVRGEIAYDGTNGRRYYDYIFAPVIGIDGDVEAIAGTTRDITERKRSEERFAQLAAASQRINASLDTERILRTAAEQARSIIGADDAAVNLAAAIGDAASADALPEGAGAPAEEAAQFARIRLEREVCRRGLPMRLGRDALRQHPAWLAMAGRAAPPAGWLATPLLGHGGQCLGVIEVAGCANGSFSDEDAAVLAQLATVVAVGLENARLYDSLRLADQRKDEFLATLAHELRNPLAPLRYALELIGRAPQPAQRESARLMASRQLGQLVRLVDDLLDVARISLGKLQLRRQPITLQQVVASAVEASRPMIDARGQQLRIELPDAPLHVDADPTRLAQVLVNLLNNAAKYSEPGTRIELHGGEEGDCVLLCVRDQGIGIPEPMLARIFEPFSQLEHATERSHGGLGIGLTLVRRLVELHGGQVEARSAGPGRGSEFVVRLPRLATAEDQVDAPDRDASAAVRRRVLVVDDNHDAATSLTTLLESLGHEARAAFDGHQALAMATEQAPEVVVLDIGMPGLDGYEVARRLRRIPRVCDAVLIALTGWGQDADRRASRDAGFDHHLVKPADLDELQRLVAGAPLR
jgi:PAS domain S-box-containing protein